MPKYKGHYIEGYESNSYDEQNTINTYYCVDGINNHTGEATTFDSLREAKDEIDYIIKESVFDDILQSKQVIITRSRQLEPDFTSWVIRCKTINQNEPTFKNISANVFHLISEHKNPNFKLSKCGKKFLANPSLDSNDIFWHILGAYGLDCDCQISTHPIDNPSSPISKFVVQSIKPRDSKSFLGHVKDSSSENEELYKSLNYNQNLKN